MAFTDLEKQLIKNIIGGFCKKRTPAHLKDELRFEYRIKKQDVILIEIRPHWQNPHEIIEQEFAKLKYVRSSNKWMLYWLRASGKWLLYEIQEYSEELKDLVAEIDMDNYGCFFG